MLVQLPRDIYDRIVADMRRPHAFAFERVGFAVVGHSSLLGREPVLTVKDYFPVADEDYQHSDEAAASIGAAAIRKALQLALDSREGIFHVHSHGFSDWPLFSFTDEADHDGIIRSFRNLGVAVPYGFLLLGDGGFLMRIWLPGRDRYLDSRRVELIDQPSRSDP